MPVTAKLSKKFYDTLRDEVTNELVDLLNVADAQYRSELRDINELNFARFDAKLEQRAAELDAKIDKRYDELDAKIDKRYGELDAKIDRRFGELDAKINKRYGELDAKIDQRFSELDAKIDTVHGALNARIKQLDAKIDGLPTAIGRDMEAVRSDLMKWMFFFVATGALAVIGLG
jgi:tetrahydromethanopterin S-methyltransferase subunit G